MAKPLRPSKRLAVASPAYLARHGTPDHPSERSGHNGIAIAAAGHVRQWRFSRNRETVQVPVEGSMSSNNGLALMTAAIAGVGITVQNDALLEPAIAAGQLVRLLPDWDLPPRPVHIVRRHEAHPSAKLRSFIDFVVDHLGDR